MTELRAAFVMEQTLGHVTHYQNLRTAVARQDHVQPTWIMIPFETNGLEKWVPGYRANWSVRASVRARRRLSAELAARPHGAAFFHTQVTALFSAGLMRRIPSVVSLDATPVNYDTIGAAYGHAPATGTWLDQRKHRLNRDAFHAARAIVSWSEWAKASLIADYDVPAERISVISPGAAREYFAIGETRPAERSREVPIRLLFVGGDFARKGGPLLLDAIRAARTARAFEVHLVTQHEVAPEAGVIVHHGLRPNTPELLKLFADADAFILPSNGECLALVLMEASAAALPIIATNVGAMAEAAVPGRSAIVVAPRDGRALRAALETIVDNDAQRRRLGQAAFALARAKFDAERNGQRIVDIVRSIARPESARMVA